MKRTPISALLLSAMLGASCGDEDAAFDARAFIGTWRGRWMDEAGHRGGIDLVVTKDGDTLHLACGVTGRHLPGLRPETEQVEAVIRGRRASIADHYSEVFGQVSGTIDADGRVSFDCEGMVGPVHSLSAFGTWHADTLTAEIDVAYDSSLRNSRAYVELRRRGRD